MSNNISAATNTINNNNLTSRNVRTPNGSIASSGQRDGPSSSTNNLSLNNDSRSFASRNTPAGSSFKDQKKSYHMKKKYFSKNIQSAIETTLEVHSGWLKARTSIKRWTKVWCQVKPGYLIIYNSQEAQKRHRLGVVLLSVCQLIKRPSKKEGFCFKLLNPFDCSVWAKSSTRGALAFPQSSLTMRASDVSVARLWLDALNRCHLSANLEGYQPVITEDQLFEEDGPHCNRSILSDTSEERQSTQRLDGCLLLNRTSNNNSVASSLGGSGSANGGIKNKLHIDDVCKPILANGNNTSKFIQHSTGGKFCDTLERNTKTTTINTSTFKRSNNNNRNKFDENDNLKRATTGGASSHSELTSKFNNSHIQNGIKSSVDYKSTNNSTTGSTIIISPNSTKMVAKFSKYNWRELKLENVNYVNDGAYEELGIAGVQSEEVHESNKNFLWHIIKQLRPGMDLSKVTLPTFILEPRSFLEKLADYYYHSNILSEAILINDPIHRLIGIVKWYLSGFYKKPKGPKKPYNPILGERFRCFWEHSKTHSRTFFVAEQVSHHPPISAFHVSNRKDGYTITCALLSKSKFGGNSVSAILDGKARLYLNRRNETYTITMPYANCRGILLGSLCMELGGRVEIECVETGYKCELDFKLAPVWAGTNSYNSLTGKILKPNSIATHTIEGHWDKKITIHDKRSQETSTLWEVTDAIRQSRLKRYTVSVKDQAERESAKLWAKVTEALTNNDQIMATTEKTRLEDMQRQEARERNGTFIPEHFRLNPDTNEWTYRWLDNRAWDERRDILQFEDDFKIKTLMIQPSPISSTKDGSADGVVITQQHIPDPDLDLSLTQLTKCGSYQTGVGTSESTMTTSELEVEHGALKNRRPVGLENCEALNPDAFKTIESKIDAENMLIKLAIEQVNQRNSKLEQDLATLKRGRRAAALVMAAIIVLVLSAYMGYFP